jgi:hypothetical protein
MRNRVMDRITAAFVDAISALVPGGARREFRDEWHAELSCLSGGATKTALRASGALPDAIALLRQEWSLDMLLQDIRYALRLLARRYGFTALVILTLGLGIGANTAVFSVIDGVLLRPLPFPDDSRLVAVWEDDRINARPKYPVAPANYLDWLNENRSLESLSAFVQNTVDLTNIGEPARLGAAVVWPTFFDTLGVKPLRGRTFTMDDAKGQNFRVVVLSHRAWTTHLASDPNVVGRELTSEAAVPRRRRDAVQASAFPIGRRPVRPLVPGAGMATVRAQHFFSVVGRLRKDVTRGRCATISMASRNARSNCIRRRTTSGRDRRAAQGRDRR